MCKFLLPSYVCYIKEGRVKGRRSRLVTWNPLLGTCRNIVLCPGTCGSIFLGPGKFLIWNLGKDCVGDVPNGLPYPTDALAASP